MSNVTTRLIFNKLDQIENKLGIMAHEIPEIADYLRDWQDGKLNPIFFSAKLSKFIDQINS